jgi:multicomponent Na+:H+ antiporter subunit F
VNAWLWAATVLGATLAPLVWRAARRPPVEGVVALEVAGTVTVAILLCIAEGTERQPFADLALVLGLVSFAGAVAFLRFLERLR